MFDVRFKLLAVASTISLALVVACSGSRTPGGPSDLGAGASVAHLGHGIETADTTNPNAGSRDEHGDIAGWFNGETVQLHYTKLYFCAEPPDSSATTHCELGAAAEVDPRPGPIPSIYAIAAAGIQP